MNVDLDIKVSRSYESSVFSTEPDQGIPFGDRNYILVIDGYIRISISREQAESLVEYAQVKEDQKKRSLARPKKGDDFLHPTGAEFFSSGSDIPDPPEEETANAEEEEEDDASSDDYSGTDDAGDGVGQF